MAGYFCFPEMNSHVMDMFPVMPTMRENLLSYGMSAEEARLFISETGFDPDYDHTPDFKNFRICREVKLDIEDSRVLPLMLKRKFCAFVDAYHRSAVTSEHGVISQSEMCPLCLDEEAKTVPLCVNTWQETPGSTDKTGHGVCDNCLPMYLKPNPARCLICKEEYNKDDISQRRVLLGMEPDSDSGSDDEDIYRGNENFYLNEMHPESEFPSGTIVWSLDYRNYQYTGDIGPDDEKALFIGRGHIAAAFLETVYETSMRYKIDFDVSTGLNSSTLRPYFEVENYYYEHVPMDNNIGSMMRGFPMEGEMWSVKLIRRIPVVSRWAFYLAAFYILDTETFVFFRLLREDMIRVSGDGIEMRVAASNAFTDVYNWTVGNTAKLNKVWNHYRKFFVDYIKYLVQYCSQDNDTDILNELKKKEKRLYEFESVDSCHLTSIPGLKEATTEWKCNGWKEEFKTNSQLSKFLNKNLVNISKLLTCKAYYQKCIAYQALQASMQPMFESFLKSGLKKIVEGVEKKLELSMDAFNVLDNFMRVWDGDLDDVMDEIKFCWDMNAENLQDILKEFDAKRESAPDNQFLIKIYEYWQWLLEKENEEQDDDH